MVFIQRPQGPKPQLGLSTAGTCQLDDSEKVTQLLCASVCLTIHSPGENLWAGTTPFHVCVPRKEQDPGIQQVLRQGGKPVLPAPDKYVRKYRWSLTEDGLT